MSGEVASPPIRLQNGEHRPEEPHPHAERDRDQSDNSVYVHDKRSLSEGRQEIGSGAMEHRAGGESAGRRRGRLSSVWEGEEEDIYQDISDAKALLEPCGERTRHGRESQQAIFGTAASSRTSSSGRSSRNSSVELSTYMPRDESADTLTVGMFADQGPPRSSLANEAINVKNDDVGESIELDRFDLPDGHAVGQKCVKDDLVQLAVQATPSLVTSVLGEMLTGWLLDVVQHWPVFTDIKELFILVSILLNLKGNLEMNLAARLTTAANMGHLDKRRSRSSLVAGNLSLLQLQSLVVGAVAGLFAYVLGAADRSHPGSWSEVALLITASMGCAAISSLVLGAFMCALVICSRKFNVNPANIATPIGASLGDLVTLVVLAMFGSMLRVYAATALNSILVFWMLVCIPIWMTMIYRNEYVRDLISAGWIPMFSAMAISSFSGLMLEKFIGSADGMAMLVPVFNGISGNIGSIFASRISSALHAGSEEAYHKAGAVLFVLNFLIQAGFLLIAHLLDIGHVHVDITFFVFYVSAGVLIAAAILVLAKEMTIAFWRNGYDPDNCVLPLLTALCDVFGTSLLVGVFAVYKLIHPANAAPS